MYTYIHVYLYIYTYIYTHIYIYLEAGYLDQTEALVNGVPQLDQPLPRTGTRKTVKARFRPWLSDKNPQTLLSCSL